MSPLSIVAKDNEMKVILCKYVRPAAWHLLLLGILWATKANDFGGRSKMVCFQYDVAKCSVRHIRKCTAFRMFKCTEG